MRYEVAGTPATVRCETDEPVSNPTPPTVRYVGSDGEREERSSAESPAAAASRVVRRFDELLRDVAGTPRSALVPTQLLPGGFAHNAATPLRAPRVTPRLGAVRGDEMVDFLCLSCSSESEAEEEEEWEEEAEEEMAPNISSESDYMPSGDEEEAENVAPSPPRAALPPRATPRRTGGLIFCTADIPCESFSQSI